MASSEEVQAVFESADLVDDFDDYLAAVDKLVEVTDEKARDVLIAKYIYNKHNTFLRGGDYDNCKLLLRRYLALIPKIGQTQGMLPGAVSGRMIRIQEGLAGDACALWSLSKDDTVWSIVEALLPKKITLPPLAYNLACAAALRRDKPRLLEFVGLAMNLGKEKSQFMADTDFDAFKSDPEFLAALE